VPSPASSRRLRDDLTPNDLPIDVANAGCPPAAILLDAMDMDQSALRKWGFGPVARAGDGTNRDTDVEDECAR